MQGTVKVWKSDLGWGFITGEDLQDYFCHFTNIEGEGRRNLTEGEWVDFEPVTTERGLAVRHLKVITKV